jgi:hypothetical protein
MLIVFGAKLFSRVRVFWFKHADFAVRSARVDVRIKGLLTAQFAALCDRAGRYCRAKPCAPRAQMRVEIAVPDLADHSLCILAVIDTLRRRNSARVSTPSAQSNHLAPARQTDGRGWKRRVNGQNCR